MSGLGNKTKIDSLRKASLKMRMRIIPDPQKFSFHLNGIHCRAAVADRICPS